MKCRESPKCQHLRWNVKGAFVYVETFFMLHKRGELPVSRAVTAVCGSINWPVLHSLPLFNLNSTHTALRNNAAQERRSIIPHLCHLINVSISVWEESGTFREQWICLPCWRRSYLIQWSLWADGIKCVWMLACIEADAERWDSWAGLTHTLGVFLFAGNMEQHQANKLCRSFTGTKYGCLWGTMTQQPGVFEISIRTFLKNTAKPLLWWNVVYLRVWP